MSEVEERLNRLRQAGRLKRRGGRNIPEPQQPAPGESGPVEDSLDDLLELPGMELVDGPLGPFLLRTKRYDLRHQQGRANLGQLLDIPTGVAAVVGRDPTLAELDFRQVAFIDTETSGLAGGTGTIVFLTGVGRFEDDNYVVRQYFARNAAEEPAYLHYLSDLLSEMGGLVSFNGKSFDLPLLRSRFIMAGIQSAADTLPHLDLLHPSRRLWRNRLGACNFGNLETNVLGHVRTGQDVPSWMIPGLWFQFASDRSNARDMERVLYHNEEDIVSMVPLAHELCGTFSGVLDPHPEDLLALATSFARQDLLDDAESVYRRALDRTTSRSQRIEIISGIANILKRKGEREQAAIWWESMTDTASLGMVEPYVELAKYHEWETKDLNEARRWTMAALDEVSQWRPSYERTGIVTDLNHRLQRLLRKLEGSS